MLSDSQLQRQRMIDGQLTPNGITNASLLAAMRLVPREFFVPMAFAASAYVDEEIPLANGRALLEPMVLARLIQALQLNGIERVLIIAGAMGYSAAVIAHLTAEVVMVESDAALMAHARTALPLLGLRTIELVESALDAPQVSGEFDAILVEGALHALPPTILKKLSEGGSIAWVEQRGRRADGVKGMPIGLGALQVATKRSGALKIRQFAEAGVTLLPGFSSANSFVFA